MPGYTRPYYKKFRANGRLYRTNRGRDLMRYYYYDMRLYGIPALVRPNHGCSWHFLLTWAAHTTWKTPRKVAQTCPHQVSNRI